MQEWQVQHQVKEFVSSQDQQPNKASECTCWYATSGGTGGRRYELCSGSRSRKDLRLLLGLSVQVFTDSFTAENVELVLCW